MILQAWLTLPSCLASSSRPALARMIFWSLVITAPGAAVAGAAQPRPASPPPRLKVRDRLGVPGGDGVEVFGEVARPGAANRLEIVLAGCEGDANGAARRAGVDRGEP